MSELPITVRIPADESLKRPGISPRPYDLIIERYADLLRFLVRRAPPSGEGPWGIAHQDDGARQRFDLYATEEAAVAALRTAVLAHPEYRSSRRLVRLMPSEVA